MPTARYSVTVAGPEGTVFIGERGDGPGLTLHKFSLEERESSVFLRGVSSVSVSDDGTKMLLRTGRAWRVVDTGGRPDEGTGMLSFQLRMLLDRRAE